MQTWCACTLECLGLLCDGIQIYLVNSIHDLQWLHANSLLWGIHTIQGLLTEFADHRLENCTEPFELSEGFSAVNHQHTRCMGNVMHTHVGKVVLWCNHIDLFFAVGRCRQFGYAIDDDVVAIVSG